MDKKYLYPPPAAAIPAASAPALQPAPAGAPDHRAHGQAVEMKDTVVKKQGIPDAVTALATKNTAQAPEIDKMTVWLQNRNEPATRSPAHGMTGMGTEDMPKLDTARGAAPSKPALIIASHKGAVMMVRTEEFRRQPAAPGPNVPRSAVTTGVLVAARRCLLMP